MKRATLLVLVALWPSLAAAGLTEQQIGEVALAPAPEARVPMDLPFRSLDGRAMTLGEAVAGRPTLLMPVDYSCRETCGPALSIAAAALAGTSLISGTDYSLVAFGIRDGDTTADAARFTAGQVGGPGVSVLTGDRIAVAALTRAIGYGYVQDAENGVVAHPAAFVALTPDGRVSRALSSLALEPTDLRLALIEAGEGRIGGLVGRLTLLCYGFDAVHGIYTRRIEWLLRIAGLVTVACLAAAIGFMHWRARRRASA